MLPTQAEIQAAALFGAQPSYALLSVPNAVPTTQYGLYIRMRPFTRLISPPYRLGFEIGTSPSNPDFFTFWDTDAEVWGGLSSQAHSIGLNFGDWNHLFAAVDTNHQGPTSSNPNNDPKVGQFYLNRLSINNSSSTNPNADGGDPAAAAYTIALSNSVLGMPRTTWDSDPANNMQFSTNFTSTFSLVVADTFLFDSYINPSSSNLETFASISSDGICRLPGNRSAPLDAFGPALLALRRDNISGLLFQDNLGTGGSPTVVGTDPIDIPGIPEFEA